jgi:hypothetical protein
MLQVFFKVTEGQTPDPEWEARLSKISDKFRDMGTKAASWMGGKPGAEPNAGDRRG